MRERFTMGVQIALSKRGANTRVVPASTSDPPGFVRFFRSAGNCSRYSSKMGLTLASGINGRLAAPGLPKAR